MATRKMRSPMRETHMPLQRSRKSRWRRGVSMRTRLKPPGRSRPSYLWCIGARGLGGALRRRRGRGLRGQELDDALGVHGAGEREALALVAAEIAQGPPRLGELDAPRDDLELQRLAERHDGRREAGRLRRGV